MPCISEPCVTSPCGKNANCSLNDKLERNCSCLDDDFPKGDPFVECLGKCTLH